MKRTGENIVNESPWRRANDAMAFFQVGRATLDKVAEQAGAKRKIGRLALYDIRTIESFINKVGAI